MTPATSPLDTTALAARAMDRVCDGIEDAANHALDMLALAFADAWASTAVDDLAVHEWSRQMLDGHPPAAEAAAA